MAISKAHFIVQPTFDGSPGILVGVGAPAAEIYDKGTIYNRSDAVGVYQSDGAGVWTQLLDSASVNGSTAPAFTGGPAMTAEVDAFTGSGFATAGQVVTTTDNQTMTLNQCAGMWLITATHAPCLIVSNTAVSGAPAVLTVYGAAPATTAEGYRILKAPTPAGSVASHTHAITP